MAILLDFCIPEDRDLSTGLNFNPQNIAYISVVKIFASPESRTCSLHLNKISHFWMGTTKFDSFLPFIFEYEIGRSLFV